MTNKFQLNQLADKIDAAIGRAIARDQNRWEQARDAFLYYAQSLPLADLQTYTSSEHADTQEKLHRMYGLNSIIKQEEDSTEEYIYEEYRRLQAEMVAAFLPMIRRLTKAGLFTAMVEDQAGGIPEAETRQWD